MNNYKIVACDLDGTLLNSNLTVSQENKNAIKSLTGKGVHFVPCTGRSLSEMPEVLDIPDIRYVIYSNGAVILDRKTGEHTLMCLSKEISRSVLDTLCLYETYIVIHHNGKVYADAKLSSEKFYEYYNVCFTVQQVVAGFSVLEDDFENLIYSMDNIESICVFFKNDAEMQECKNRLDKNGRLFVAEGWEYNLEIFSAEAGKGNALRRLARMLDIDLENTVSIGDSGNDISVTETAGLGLAVSNACDKLKHAADKIICSNDEHAVQYVLSEYF